MATAELSDLEGLKRICEGMDTVVHMAGMPSPSATWQELLDANIIGTYNILVAAKAAGCSRVVLASSIHAVSGYPPDVQVKTTEPINPGDLYGVTKCFGEAMGRYMAGQEKLSVIAIRIGAFQPIESLHSGDGALGMLDAFVSQRDLHQLLERAIDVQDVQFAVFHGLSNNRFKRLDITDAREILGYQPQDDAVEETPQTRPLGLSKKVGAQDNEPREEKSGIRDELKELKTQS